MTSSFLDWNDLADDVARDVKKRIKAVDSNGQPLFYSIPEKLICMRPCGRSGLSSHERNSPPISYFAFAFAVLIEAISKIRMVEQVLFKRKDFYRKLHRQCRKFILFHSDHLNWSIAYICAKRNIIDAQASHCLPQGNIIYTAGVTSFCVRKRCSCHARNDVDRQCGRTMLCPYGHKHKEASRMACFFVGGR